jgi:hypothetical protein
MLHRIATALAAVSLLVLIGCSGGSPAPIAHHTDATSLAAKAETGLYVTGTLAALGSFEWDAAPLYSHNAMVRHTTAVALKRGMVSLEDAQRVLDETDAVRALLDQSLAACQQDDRTGKCRGDEKHARALLDAARKQLAAAH